MSIFEKRDQGARILIPEYIMKDARKIAVKQANNESVRNIIIELLEEALQARREQERARARRTR